MKRRSIIIGGILYILVGLIILVTVYINLGFDLSISEYIEKSQPITKEEKEWLKEHGSIIYGLDQSSPPLRYRDEGDGQYKGVIVDLINYLSIKVGQEITFQENAWWIDSINGLYSREIDFFDLIPSEERSHLLSYTDPIYMLEGNILQRKDSKEKINSYKDLQGKTVAIPEGDYSIEFLNKRVKGVRIVDTANIESSINLLQLGKVDAVIGDEPVIQYYIDEMGLVNTCELLEEPIYKEEVVLAVPKGEDELVSILNKGIFQVKKDNIHQSLNSKWNLNYTYIDEIFKNTIPEIAYVLAGIIYVGIYIFYVCTYILKREVKKKTVEVTEGKNTLEAIFNSITDTIILVDSDYKIINANASFDYVKKENEEFNIEMFEEIIDNAFYENEKYTKEIELENKVLEVTSFPVDDKTEQVHRAVVIIKDITKDRLVEKQILRDSKMVAIGQLAAGIAHEIRNPLGIIRNYCYLLKEDDTELKEAKEYVLSIEKNVDRASNIVFNLLNFARISNESNACLNVRDLLVNIIKLEEKVISQKGIQISIECSNDLIFCTNEESLKHIIINLLTNSIDAIGRNGKIEINCSVVNSKLNIDFKDNGEGIKESNLKEIFNPFYTTKPVGKGTGLGLYITYNEVNKLGGYIDVESKVNEGTCFYIKIPSLGGLE